MMVDYNNYEVMCDPKNIVIADDLEWPLSLFSLFNPLMHTVVIWVQL